MVCQSTPGSKHPIQPRPISMRPGVQLTGYAILVVLVIAYELLAGVGRWGLIRHSDAELVETSRQGLGGANMGGDGPWKSN